MRDCCYCQHRNSCMERSRCYPCTSYKKEGGHRTPEIKMLNDALFWMVKEGEEIKAEEESRPVNEVDRNKILRKVDIPPKDLGTLLHEEFQRCFERKNEKTTQRTE